jgi:hypothetical protein
MTKQQQILEAKTWEDTNDFRVTDKVVEVFNCREVEISEDGNVWIADPQAGHWLSDEDLQKVLDYMA